MARKSIERNISYDDVKDLYYVTFYYGIVNGEKKQETKTFKTKKEARAALTEFESKKSKGLISAPNKITMGELFKVWLEFKKNDGIEETTYVGYKRLIVQDMSVSLLDRYFKQKLSDIEDENDRIAEAKEEGIELKPSRNMLHNNSLVKIYDLLGQIFKYAIKKDIVATNIMAKVDKPKKIEYEATPYTPEELKELLSTLGDYHMDLCIAFCAYLGLRKGEALGIRWKDIDFEAGTVLIIETITVAGGKIIIKKPKTKESIRIMALPGELKSTLLKAKERYDNNKALLGDEFYNSGRVVSNPYGEPPHPDSISNYFKEHLKSNGLRHIRLHDLRHTFASIAIAEGVKIYDVSKSLGHSKVGTTTDIYAHQLLKINTAAVASVAKAVAG